MATVKAFIRTEKKKADRVKVRFRLTDGRSTQLFYNSDIEVDSDKWDSKQGEYKARALVTDQERHNFNSLVSDRKNMLLNIYSRSDKDGLTSKVFCSLIDKELHPEKYKPEGETIFESFDIFLIKKNVSKNRKINYTALKRILQRYEVFTAINLKKPFQLTFESFTADLLDDFVSFLRNEYTLCEEQKYKPVYQLIKECRKPQARGQNTISDILNRTRTFFIWAIDTERTTNNPFKNYSIPAPVYGSPLYITIDERNKIYHTDLSSRPDLEAQRDVFVFQCLTGCRFSDLRSLTPDSVINGAIEYIQAKTKEGHPVTVRVPLNDLAKEIVNKYKGVDKKARLLPFLQLKEYNEAIKEVFKAAGITRIVTVLNSTTREEEKKPISEIASSHMARRTFVGNLYKKVKDPNLVGSLSGHKEGSKAFARYRDIDDEIKKEVIKYLD